MRIMLIGPSAAGKTTLIQRLIDKEIKYDKTQTVEYVGNFIDTPGEYMQQRGYWGSLTITSHDADIIGLVQDSTSEDCWFSGGLTTKFEKPVVGILTKIDREDSNQKQGPFLSGTGWLQRYFRGKLLHRRGCGRAFRQSSQNG